MTAVVRALAQVVEAQTALKQQAAAAATEADGQAAAAVLAGALVVLGEGV
jgi:hypothetical protein